MDSRNAISRPHIFKRPLKDNELTLWKSGKCIGCATTIQGNICHVSEPKKSKLHLPLESQDCKKTRRRLHSPTSGHSFGACRASMHHEFRRRLGATNHD